jgi:hypothetical protein
MEQSDFILHLLAHVAEQPDRLVNRNGLIFTFYMRMVKLVSFSRHGLD